MGAVEMANGVSTALGLKLPQTLVFDYPSVESMSLHLFGLVAPTDAASIPSIQAPSITVQANLQAASVHQPIQVSLLRSYIRDRVLFQAQHKSHPQRGTSLAF